MKVLLFTLLFLSFAVNAASPIRQIYCMETDNSNEKPIRLTYVIIYYNADNWVGSYVKYSNSDKPISLNLVDSKHIDNGTKSELITEEWVEFINGILNGHYAISSQGVYITNFVYTSKKGANYIFKENKEAFSPSNQSCDWNKAT